MDSESEISMSGGFPPSAMPYEGAYAQKGKEGERGTNIPALRLREEYHEKALWVYNNNRGCGRGGETKSEIRGRSKIYSKYLTECVYVTDNGDSVATAATTAVNNGRHSQLLVDNVAANPLLCYGCFRWLMMIFDPVNGTRMDSPELVRFPRLPRLPCDTYSLAKKPTFRDVRKTLRTLPRDTTDRLDSSQGNEC